MTPTEAIPTTANIPSLQINIEGLKRHSFLCMFAPEPSLSIEQIRLRSWLLHTLTGAARHYIRARELVALQDRADQTLDGGVVFHVLDVAEHLEGCVNALFRVLNALERTKEGLHNAARWRSRTY